MTPLHQRVHKIVHRLIGLSTVAVGALQSVQAIDLTPLLAGHAGATVAAIGIAIAALEALPLVVKVFESEDEE